MDSLSQNAQHSIEFLIYTSTFLLIVIGVVLIKLMLDISSLVKSLQRMLLILKPELGPTIKELKRALINVNSIASRTDSQFKDINNAISNTISAFTGSSQSLASKAKVAFSTLKKGIDVGLKVFLDKNQRNFKK